jgi:hypothetical protein
VFTFEYSLRAACISNEGGGRNVQITQHACFPHPQPIAPLVQPSAALLLCLLSCSAAEHTVTNFDHPLTKFDQQTAAHDVDSAGDRDSFCAHHRGQASAH